MALQDVNSGVFSTSNQYIKYCTEMIENSTNTAANTSNVTIRVWAWRTNTYGPTYGTGTCYCTIAGTQYSAAISSSQKIGTSWICLFEKTLDIAHNGDGTGRVDTYAQITMDVVTSSSQGWGFGLTTIARASVPTLSVSTQTMGQTITISTNRRSTSFTHTLVVGFGGYNANIAFNVTDNFVWTLPIAELCAQIPSADAGWGGITCHTYNGGTLIGSNVINFTALVPSSVVPTASGLSVAIDGTGRDKTLAKYIQAISKVSASFSSAGIYGSTISSNIINVKRQSDSGDSQNISGTSGVTANPISLSGTYVITATATDSRGRSASVSTTITVQAYSLPTIIAFSAGRGSPTTTVNASFNVTWSPIGTSNPATVLVKNKNNVGTIATLYTLSNSTAGTVNTTQAYTSQVDTSSYEYTITVTDSFGKVATATVTIGVSFVEFCLAKGYGIGVGKIWERGAVDVGGDIFITGKMYGRLGAERIPAYADLDTYTTEGLYYSPLNADVQTMTHRPSGNAFSLLVEKHAQTKQTFTDYMTGNWVQYTRNRYGDVWGKWRRSGNDISATFMCEGTGQNLSAGTWARATFGTQSVNDAIMFNSSNNMFNVGDEGWYHCTYWVRINQSINTWYNCQIWGRLPNTEIMTTLTTNNGWNTLYGGAVVYLYPGINYEYVIKQDDGGYVRPIDKHRITVSRIA